MKAEDIIKGELIEAKELLSKIINEPAMLQSINQAALLMANAINKEHKIISCGNGGSHCDAMHFSEELTGKYRADRQPIPAISISDSSHITCVGNDYGFDQIFSRYIEAVGQEGDILLGITTSGNSQNIQEAVMAAKRKGMTSIVLTGNDGGEVSKIANLSLIVPHTGFSDRIQEIHIKIIHILILLIEKSIH